MVRLVSKRLLLFDNALVGVEPRSRLISVFPESRGLFLRGFLLLNFRVALLGAVIRDFLHDHVIDVGLCGAKLIVKFLASFEVG